MNIFKFIIDTIALMLYDVDKENKYKGSVIFMTDKQKGAKIGYIRVSTVEQNTARQESKLESMVDKLFIDKCSGKDKHRPKLTACLEYLREGDTLYIDELSRLGRNLKDLIDIIETLNKKGVALISLKENLDTATPQGKLMFQVIGAIGEFERELLLQRQREGIQEAKKAGKYKGRKQKEKPTNWEELYSQYMSRQKTATEVAKECEVSRTVLYKWFNEEKEKDYKEK